MAPGTAVRGRQADRRGGAQGSPGAPVTVTLPVFPSFSFQETATTAKLNELAYDAAFLLTPPQALLVSNSAQSIPASTLTAITWASATWAYPGTLWTSGSRVTVQALGYYDLDTQVTYAANSTGARQVMFRVTTGPRQPGRRGNTTIFGLYSTVASSTPPLVTGMLSPYMYAGDYVEVLAFQSSGGSLNTATPWCQLAVCLISLGP